jgi:hypothetical protein
MVNVLNIRLQLDGISLTVSVCLKQLTKLQKAIIGLGLSGCSGGMAGTEASCQLKGFAKV